MDYNRKIVLIDDHTFDGEMSALKALGSDLKSSVVAILSIQKIAISKHRGPSLPSLDNFKPAS